MTETALTTLRYTDEQTQLIRRTLAPQLDDDQFALFMTVAIRAGLDPIAKQIYAIPRTKKVKKGNNWVNQVELTIQVGIDGYRALAQRTGHYTGQGATEWCDYDGNWQDVWLADEPPAAARVTVFRDGEAYSHVATFKEFVQTVDEYDGDRRTGARKPNSMWSNMPANQLAKCAEAGALRKAFPAELAGIFVDAEEAGLEYVVEVEGERQRPARPEIQQPRARATSHPSRPSRAAPRNQPEEAPFDDGPLEGEYEQEEEPSPSPGMVSSSEAWELFYLDLNTLLDTKWDLTDVAHALGDKYMPNERGIRAWWEENKHQQNLIPFLRRKLEGK